MSVAKYKFVKMSEYQKVIQQIFNYYILYIKYAVVLINFNVKYYNDIGSSKDSSGKPSIVSGKSSISKDVSMISSLSALSSKSLS